MDRLRWLRTRLQAISTSVTSLLKRSAGHPPARGRAGIAPYVNRIISDAILFNERPSPTENEAERCEFLTRRLGEFGISEVAVSSEGNVSFVHPGESPAEDSILLLANTENESYSPLGSLVRLTPRLATGSGIADNSLGVAALLVLAEYLHKNGIRFGSNLLFLFTPRRGGIAGALRGFVGGWGEPVRAAVVVAGIELGDLETKPLGNCRFTVTIKAPERNVFPDPGGASAVSVLAHIASRLSSIHWSEGGETILNIARMRAGVGYGYFPSEGVMDVEIYSTSASVLQMACNAASATIQKTASEARVSAEIVTTAAAPVSSAERNVVLIEALEQVHRQLGIRSRTATTGALAAAVSALDVPAITVGITRGRRTLTEEFIEIAPVETGFRQLLMLLERVAAPTGEAA
jgi:tripeptide aminopeptidase